MFEVLNCVAAKPVTSNNGTVKLKASNQSMWYEGTDEQSACPVQMSDVQGPLKQKLPFWK